MILVDANLLLYAYDTSSPRHEAARRWLEDALSGPDAIRIGLATILAFLRIGTDPRVFDQPLAVAEAIAIVRTWLQRPNCSIASPSDRHWPVLEAVAVAGQARGPMLMDAHLAALAIEHGATVATTDRDFSRFDRLRLVDPLAG